jgi:hypothetical protein
MRTESSRASKRIPLWATPVCAVGVGLIAGLLRWPLPASVTAAIAVAAALVLLESRRHYDVGAWQRRIDQEFQLSVEGQRVTVVHHGRPVTQFEFAAPLEVQYLSRKEFPPLYWKIVTQGGEYLVPDGGAVGTQFSSTFVYTLPGYEEQQVVRLPAPAGFDEAKSMWRKSDSFSKRASSDDPWGW